MREFAIASIPGDGIGKEVVPAGQRVLDTVAEVFGDFKFNYQIFDWSCEYYARHGKMMPDNGLKILKEYDAIFLGAIGFPGILWKHMALMRSKDKTKRERDILQKNPSFYCCLHTGLDMPEIDVAVIRRYYRTSISYS